MKKLVATCLASLALLTVLPLRSFASDDVVTADSFVDLNLHKTFCITVGLHPPLRNQTSEQFLLSINGEDLTHKTFDQIEKKLAGPVGSQVKVEIGYPTGSTEIFDITRKPRDDQTRRNADPIQELSNRLVSMKSAYNPSNLVENSAYNCDLFARASCTRAVESIAEKSRNELGVLMNCVLLSYSIGDFEAAEKYLARAINFMKLNPADNNTNYRDAAIIEDLIILGKNDDAEFVCKYLLQPSSNHGARLPQPITVLASYSLIPTNSAQEACKQLAQQIFSGRMAQATSFDEDNYWLAQYLESLGLNDKALELYGKTLKRIGDSSYPASYLGTHHLVFGLYCKARLEAVAGKADDARRDLESITASYKLLSEKQQQLVNRIPELFPNLNDVDNALASLKKTGTIPAPPKIVGYSNQDPFVLSGSSQAFRTSFQKAKLCVSLIRANKRSEAAAVADQLILAYRASEPSRPYFPVRQNLFCTNLHFARLFADRGWYDESNKLLNSLESAAKSKSASFPPGDIAWVMLDAEKISNAVLKTGKDPEPSVWQTLNPGVRAPNGLSLADRLSLLAGVYSSAGEPQRAKLYIDRAVKTIDTADGVYGTNSAEKQALIYMNAACIYARQSDWRNAENFSKLALTSVRRLDNNLALAAVEAATAFSSKGKVSQAIFILETATKLEPQRGAYLHEPNFGRNLADLYAKNGQPDKALSTITNIIESNRGPSAGRDYMRAGELSEQAKDYARAAEFYYQAGKLYGNGLTDEQREAMLRKSIQCAGLVKDFDKSSLARAYKDLSGLIRNNPDEALMLLEKSVALMPDSDPEKPGALSSLSYLRANAKGKNIPQASSASMPSKVNDTSSDYQREPLQRAAELAAKNNSNNAGALWLQLARQDVDAKNIDAAVANARKAIATYQSASVKKHVLSQLIDETLPQLLAKAGAPDKAEMILREAQKQVDTVAGAGSLQSQIQMSHYFRYLFSQKLYAQADSVLDELLKTNLNQGNYSPPNHNVTHCGFGGGPFLVESSWVVLDQLMSVHQTVGDSENSHQLHVLNKVLNAEKKQFGKDDYRIGLTFARIARVYAAANQNDEAYKNFIAAINIMHQHEKMMFVLSNLYPDFSRVMLKLHRQSELDKLEDTSTAEQKARHGG